MNYSLLQAIAAAAGVSINQIGTGSGYGRGIRKYPAGPRISVEQSQRNDYTRLLEPRWNRRGERIDPR